jgi:hypothetical protein
MRPQVDQKRLASVAITVELAPDLTRFLTSQGESQNFEQYLLAYLSDFLSELELPLSPQIQVGRRTSGKPLALKSLRLAVNGRQAWIGPVSQINNALAGSDLAHWIANILMRRTDLFVDEEIAGIIGDAWSRAGVPWFEAFMSKLAFRDLLRALLERGFRIGRAVEWAVQCQPQPELGSDPQQVFEEIVAPLGTCSLTVALAGRLYEEAIKNANVSDSMDGANDTTFENLTRMMCDGLFYELGVYLPKVKVAREEVFTGDVYRFGLNDRSLLPEPALEAGHVLVNAGVEELNELGIEATPSTNPATGRPAALVKDVHAPKLEQNGYWFWDRLNQLVLALSGEIRKHIGDFHTRGVAAAELTMLAQAFPALVPIARARFGEDKLTRIFRGLVDEGISIRDHRTVLEGLLAIRKTAVINPEESDVLLDGGDVCAVVVPKPLEKLEISDLVNHCRRVLKRAISHKYAPSGVLKAYSVHADVENRFREVPFNPLSEDDHDALLRTIRRALERPVDPFFVLLTRFDVRFAIRQAIKSYYPGLAVLSRPELTSEVQVTILGQLTWTMEVT